MLKTVTFWIVFGLVMGFALGGTFVASPLFHSAQQEEQADSRNTSTNQNAHEKADEALAGYTKYLMIFTGALAFATLILMFATVGLYVTGEKQFGAVKQSADAAARSSEAAIASERAWVFVEVDHDNLADLMQLARFDHPTSHPDAAVVGLEMTIKFTNYGKTPAIIKELALSCIACDKDPVIPVYGVVLSPFPETVLGSHYSTHQYVHRDAQPIVHADVLALSRGEKWFWFIGRLDYSDVFGNPHTHRFYWRANGKVRWQPYDYQHYNQST